METTTKELKNVFVIGEKYTIYRISEMMAMTNKMEITVKRLAKSNQVLDDDDLVIFTPKGKRKEYVLRLESRAYQSAPLKTLRAGIFWGWNQPIKCDAEQRTGVIRGNACYNFLGSVLEIRAWIESGQLNPFFDRSAVLAIDGENEIVVFPEEVTPGQHAVIDRIMAKAS